MRWRRDAPSAGNQKALRRNDIDDSVRQPLRFAADTRLVRDCLVSACVSGGTLEDGNDPGGSKAPPP